MSSPFKVYIIYHKSLYRENTSEFTSDELSKYFIWVAVNEKLIKDKADWIPASAHIEEYKLPVFSPLLQMTNFYQNSVFFHLYWNRSIITTKYVGFGQYDMSFSANILRAVDAKVRESTDNKIFGAYPYSVNAVTDILNPAQWTEHFVVPYNKYYNTSHTLASIDGIPVFLMHTFIMPTWFFIHMMGFVESVYPSILKALQWDTRHLAGTLECVFGMCIAFGIHEGKLVEVLQLDGVRHIGAQHTGDALRGIETGKA